MRPSSDQSGLRGPPMNLCDIIQRGYLSQVHLLVSLGANLEARDSSGRTPLILTAYMQPDDWGVGVARLLIERGVRMTHRDKYGMNALHHACVYERVELARVLLNAPDFNLTQSDKFGNTALHYAAMSGNADLVRLLVTFHHRYRLPLTRVNRQGRAARDEALHASHHLCVAILDEDVSDDRPSSLNKDGDNHSECDESGTHVLVSKDDSVVPSEEEVTVSAKESKALKTDTEEEEEKATLKREDEKGGLFGSNEQVSQEELSKHLLSPYSTPPASDRSYEHKPKSPVTSPRTRKSGLRQSHHPAGTRSNARRMSSGSSCSTRSATCARMTSQHSTQGSSNNMTATSGSNNDITTSTSNSNNDIATTTTSNSNINVTSEGQSSRENSKPVLPADSEILLQQRAKSPGLHTLKRNGVLSDNTTILNIANTAPSVNINENGQVFNVPKSPPSRISSSHGFRREASLTKALHQLPPYEKDPERVIHAASEHDFRNSRQYVLKLTRMEFSPGWSLAPDTLPALVPASGAVQHEEETARKTARNSPGSWRDNIRFLYRHLEYQCCPSWRDAAQPPPEPLMMIPQWAITSPSCAGEETDEGKEKRSRRPSSSNRPTSGTMNDVSSSSSTTVARRKISAVKQRKISAISPPSGVGRGEHGQGDNHTISSSDSLSTGSKRKSDLSSSSRP